MSGRRTVIKYYFGEREENTGHQLVTGAIANIVDAKSVSADKRRSTPCELFFMSRPFSIVRYSTVLSHYSNCNAHRDQRGIVLYRVPIRYPFKIPFSFTTPQRFFKERSSGDS